ncbi:MAG TPA: hypothetical protein PK675_03740 [Clostridia bacterium]|nr:hypothetical protein [Clostridia bacterium]
MRDFSIILKTLLRQKFRFQKYTASGKKNRVLLAFIIVGVACLPMIALVAFSVYNTGLVMKTAGVVTEGYTYLITALQAVVLFTGIVSMLNTIYFSKDTEFLLPLPVKTSSIYAAKLVYVYIDELITGVLTSLLLLIPYAIAVNAPFFLYIQLLLVIIIAPMLPLLLGAILAIPLMWVIGYFKNKGIITSIVYVLLMGLLFGLYYYFIYKYTGTVAEDSLPGEMLARLIVSISDGARAILPNYLLAKTLNPVSFSEYILSFLYAILMYAALMFVAIGVSSLVYRKTVMKQLENPKKKMVVKSSEKRVGIVGALMKSDAKRLFRDPNMGTFTLFQLIIVPIILVFMLFQFNTDNLGMDAAFLKPILLVGALAFTLFMGMSTNTSATSAFTRENRNFYVLKTLPIDFKNILKAKIYLAGIFSEATLVIAAIVAGIMTKADWYYVLAMIGVYTFLNIGTTSLQVFIDLARPRLNWNTFNEGAKNNPSALMSLLIDFVMMIVVVGIGGIFLYPLFTVGTLSAWAEPAMWAVLLAISLVYMIISYEITIKNSQKLFERIEQ